MTVECKIVGISTTGNLSISSTPQGAEIFIDNVDQGVTTPATIEALPPGAHTYKLTKTDYYDSTGNFDITAGQVTTISIIMITTICTSPVCNFVVT